MDGYCGTVQCVAVFPSLPSLYLGSAYSGSDLAGLGGCLSREVLKLSMQ